MTVKPMRERNQVMVAIWGTVLAAAVVLLAMNLGNLPFVNSTSTYYADFANADGLKAGDDVRVQGMSVGEVESVDVQGDHVHVEFDIESDLHLGGSSRATIEVATVLGNLFMQVESAGSGRLAVGATIPVGRTTVPYSLLDALNAFGHFSGKTDLPKLRTSLSTLARSVAGISSKDVKAALRGLTAVSSTLAAKQGQISDLLAAANSITKTLNTNSDALVQLLVQGEDFLRLVKSRHAVISQLLRDTARLGSELDKLFAKNGTQLDSLLADLDTVTDVLVKEKKQLQAAIVNLGQFSVNITNVGGAGPWLDLLTPVMVVPDNQIKGCGKSPGTGAEPCDP